MSTCIHFLPRCPARISVRLVQRNVLTHWGMHFSCVVYLITIIIAVFSAFYIFIVVYLITNIIVYSQLFIFFIVVYLITIIIAIISAFYKKNCCLPNNNNYGCIVSFLYLFDRFNYYCTIPPIKIYNGVVLLCLKKSIYITLITSLIFKE